METKKEYFAYDFTNVHWHKKNADGQQLPGELFGEFSKFEGEASIKTVTRKAEGIPVEEISKPEMLEGTLTGHIHLSVARDLYGLTTNGLQEGIWAYGSASKTANFALTAEERDMYGQSHLLGFPNMSVTGGIKWSLENASEEVAEVEIPVKAMRDVNSNLRYDALASEITDPVVIEKWHTDFSPEMVKADYVFPS
ncbi:phage tail protein [Listeria monocytogenes]|uniref:phage tail protein n=1 Tax=Listeria TaxID=1637 RepID=UPI000E72D0BC|nr:MULTISPECIES: phage tail protein [Listeria]EAE6189441.1 phage tail protein [Listeria monocytogenes]EAK8991754.1 phage tail protein [Listeria monocytogenes]EAK8994801.1 phage tail protein [Listeria monocytogenes]EBF5351655.1 phage tail protein [Listeria monocytogenes]EBF6148503.1 phage tail protein [Listeria monocytogenes]